MMHYLWTSLRMSILTLVLTGIVYPLVTTGLAQVLFPHQANGSLVYARNVVRGSSLLGQTFSSPAYFHSRPSAAGNGYDPLASGGSNLGPTSKALVDRIRSAVAQTRRDIPGLRDVPVDMVTTSGSGLDPDITPATAFAQLPRIARARGILEETVHTLVVSNITDRQFGILGEPRVNVLQLNMLLDRLYGTPIR